MSVSVEQLKTWGKGFDDAPVAGGKTVRSYDKIGEITIPNKQEPLYLYGFDVLIGTQAQTGAESGHPLIEFNSSDLGWFAERFSLPEFGFTDPVGTQSQSVIVPSKFMAMPHDEPVNNMTIEVSLASSATMTADWDAQVSAIFGNMPVSSLPKDYVDELMNGFESKVRSLGRENGDAGKAIGSADTDITLTPIAIPKKAKQLTGLLGILNQNAGTTLEEQVPKFTFEAADITDFPPQEYPGAFAVNAPIFGTLVGGAQQLLGSKYKPVRFPLPQTSFNMAVKVQNVIVLTVAPDASQAMKFRPKNIPKGN